MLDFTSKTKKTLPVKLADNTTVILTSPKKKLFTRLSALEDTLKEREENEIGELYDEILDIAASILSQNKSGTEFTPETIDDIMDLEDMSCLITEYSKFASKIAKSPN